MDPPANEGDTTMGDTGKKLCVTVTAYDGQVVNS
jgi:hypothetical protein